MTRLQSIKMKRRAAVAALLSVVAFAFCLAGAIITGAQSEISSAEQIRDATRPYLRPLGQSKTPDDRQRILQRMVTPGGPIVAAIVVGRDRKIQAALPGRDDLVNKNLAKEEAAAPEGETTDAGQGVDGEESAGQGAAAPDSPAAALRVEVGEDGASVEARAQEGATTRPGSAETPPPPQTRSGGPSLQPPAELPPPPSVTSPSQPARTRTLSRRAAAAQRRAVERARARRHASSDDSMEEKLRQLILQAPAISGSTPYYYAGLTRESLTDADGNDTGWLFVLPRYDRRVHDLREAMLPLFIIGAVFSFMLYSFMLPWWVYVDARTRTAKAVPLALFVFLTNFLGWLTYLVIRPEADRLCPGCDAQLDPGFRLCPVCGWSAALRCHQCGRPARSDWRYCPYCEAPRPDIDPTSDLTGRSPRPWM